MGLKIRVREHKDDGSPESSWPPIKGARVSFSGGGKKVNDWTVEPSLTDDGGLAVIDAVKFKVEKEGFGTYEGVYNSPSLDGEAPVSLRRL